MDGTEAPKQEEALVHTSFRLPLSLHRRLKVVLAHDGRSMDEVLNAMIDAWVAKQERERS
jgi:predicted DNA-binding protein